MAEVQNEVASPSTNLLVEEALKRYDREYDRFYKLTSVVERKIAEDIIKRNVLPARVQSRVKDRDSLRKKMHKKLKEGIGSFGSLDKLFSAITDIPAVRITTYVESTKNEILEQLKLVFEVDEIDDRVAKLGQQGKRDNYYRAIHCQVQLKESDLDPAGPNWNLREQSCEIQICSLLAHVWNEIEHDITYKPKTGEPGQTELRFLEMLGKLSLFGDSLIENLMSAMDERRTAVEGEFQDEHDFVVRTRSLFPTCTDFATNAGALYDHLIECEFDSPAKIKALIEKYSGVEVEFTQFGEFIEKRAAESPESTQELYKLKEGSSDALLFLLLKDQAGQIVQNNPSGRGKGRPGRVVWLAKAYLEQQRHSSQKQQ